jgi:hypothetical protein
MRAGANGAASEFEPLAGGTTLYFAEKIKK